MADLIDIEKVNGIQIKMDPLTQRYQARINGSMVALKSLAEVRKRCRATFEPVEIMIVRDSPSTAPQGVYGRISSSIDVQTVRSVSEHTTTRGYRPGKEYRLHRADAYSFPLSGEMYLFDADLKAELDAIEAEGRTFLTKLDERWRKLLEERGRKLTIESLKQGKPEPEEV